MERSYSSHGPPVSSSSKCSQPLQQGWSMVSLSSFEKSGFNWCNGKMPPSCKGWEGWKVWLGHVCARWLDTKFKIIIFDVPTYHWYYTQVGMDHPLQQCLWHTVHWLSHVIKPWPVSGSSPSVNLTKYVPPSKSCRSARPVRAVRGPWSAQSRPGSSSESSW